MCTYIKDTNTGLWLSYDPATDVIIWVTFENAHCFKNETDAAIVLSAFNVGGVNRYVGRPGDRQPKP